MNARTAREFLGPALIGRFITTQAIGDYPGGRARVIELDPDPAAPEIVMNVRHPGYSNSFRVAGDPDAGIMGIFEWEEVWL